MIEGGTTHLSPSGVHLWVARIDRGSDEITQMRAVLSADEAARADSFFLDRDRNRFIAARAILRGLLAGYVDCVAESIALRYNRWGKPRLATASARSDIRFNLSYSNGIAVYAFAKNRELGVDVEMIRPGFADTHIAERFFSRTEVHALRSLPCESQANAFFDFWTRKEACVKAVGAGLSIDLSSFDISQRAEEPVAIVRGRQTKEWRLVSFRPATDYVVAVALEGTADPAASLRWF